MRTRRVAISLGAAALVMLAGVTRAAEAQPTSAAVEASQKADTHFREGNELYTQARFAEAEAAYEKAWSLKKAHDIAANLGYAEMRQGKTLEAVEHLAFAVRTWPPTGKEDKRQYAVERYLTLRKEVGALSVEVNRAGAEIYVDGKRVGIAPLEAEVFLEAGTRVVEAKLAGFESARKSVPVEKGSTGTVKLELARTAGATGETGGAAGGNVPAVGSGTSGARNAAGTDVARGTGMPKTEATGSGPSKGLIIGGAVTSALAVGAGVVFAVVSNGHASDTEALATELRMAGGENPCVMLKLADTCASQERSAKASDVFANASAWGFITGGLLGVGTAIYVLTTPKSSRLHVAATIAPGMSALSLSGTW
jgi:tetratricopeptide (TPR) repeat protein